MPPNQTFSISNAEIALQEKKYEFSMQNYFMCLIMMQQEARNCHEAKFCEALEGWISEEPAIPKARCLIPQIDELFPNSAKPRLVIIQALLRRRSSRDFLGILNLCEETKKFARDCEEDLSNLRMIECNLSSLPFSQWHMKMINDKNRNQKFANAILKNIKKSSDVVIDIGTGTGLLSVIAARKSNMIYAIEENPTLCDIAKLVFQENGVESKIKLQNSNSNVFRAVQKADLIVSEILDCCVFGESILSTFIDAHKRLAKPSTVFVPAQARVFVRLFKSLSIFERHAQNLGGMKRYRSNYVQTGKMKCYPFEPYWCCQLSDFPDFVSISEPIPIMNIDFSNLEQLENIQKWECVHQIIPSTSGTTHGFAVHFVTDLSPDNDEDCRIDTFSQPGAWDIGIYPFKEPFQVLEGRSIAVKSKIDGHQLDISMMHSDENPPSTSRYIELPIDRISQIRDKTMFDSMVREISEENIFRVLDLTRSARFEDYVAVKREELRDKTTAYSIVATCVNSPDGSFNSKAFLRLEGALCCLKNIERIIPSHIRIIGRLFNSNRIHLEARPHSESHCGVQLSKCVEKFNLREYRDIWMEEKSDIVICSQEFEIMEFLMSGEKLRNRQYSNFLNVVEVNTTNTTIDGVLYEFEICGSRDTENRALAAFLFKNRVENRDGKMNIHIDFYENNLLVSDGL